MSTRTIIRTVITPRAITRRVGPAGAGGGATTFAALTDKTTADLPAINTPLASALSGKQPLDADLTAIAALTTTANGRAMLTSANALTIGASASVSGSNTGDQDLSGYLPRLSSIAVTGTTPAFPGPLVEQPALLNGRREWLGPAGSHLQFDGFDWYLGCTDGVDTYIATVNDPTDEPWKIMPPTWGISTGTGAPTLTIDPPTLVPVTPFTGTIALAADQYGRLSPTDMIGLGFYVSDALNVAVNANGGFLTAGTGGTLPLERGGTGSTTASDARIALGAGTTGSELFGAATAAAARTTLGIRTFTKPSDESRSSATTGSTYTVDSHLKDIPLAAGKSYKIEFYVPAYVPSTEGGKVRLLLPLSSRVTVPNMNGGVSVTTWGNGAGGAISTSASGAPAGMRYFTLQAAAGHNQNRAISGAAYTDVLASAGNLSLEWAQNAPGVNATILLAGSLITVTEL
jgi:hypothetical protein